MAITAARPRRRAVIVACAGALALGLAACGGGDKDPDPAKAVPATAPIYAQLTVHPDGDLERDAKAGLEKILGTDDVEAQIDKLLHSADAPADDVDRLEEWVGSRVGVFFTGLSTEGGDYAVVLPASDPDKAKSSLKTDGKQKRSYQGVDYWVDDDGQASGVVDDYGIAGTERGFRTAVDTLKGKDVKTIDANADYRKGLDAVGADDALATVYVSPSGVVDALGRSGGVPSTALGQVRQQLQQSAGSASVAKLTIDGDAVAVDVASLGVKQSATAASSDATKALEALPGDALLGLGLGNVGEQLTSAVQQATQAAGAAGLDPQAQLNGIEQAFGIDLEDDLLSWMGDATVFVRGATIGDVGGALVIDTKDPAKARQAMRKLVDLVTTFAPSVKERPLSGVAGVDAGVELRAAGFPFPVVAAVGGGKLVVGVGASSVKAALSPSTTLADNASYKAAKAALSDVEPSFFVDVSGIVGFVRGLGLDGDPEAKQALDALGKFGSLSAGTKHDGEIQRSKLVATLK